MGNRSFYSTSGNIRIIEAAMKRLNLSEEKVYVNIQPMEYFQASIPLALDEAYVRVVKTGAVIALCFGAGLTGRPMFSVNN
jgi:3-oxoacyl-[acyl-carrier-protein] synthase-3